MTTFNGFFITGDAIQAHHRRRGDRKNSGRCNKSLKSILTKKKTKELNVSNQKRELN